MKYSIFEGNLERLEKKLKRIENKCKKYGADFHYEVVGEEFKECVNGNGDKFISKFIIVDVEGFAKVNGWEFVASIDHHEEGNVIRNIIDIEIPQKYWITGPFCEHCNTNRRRKDTFLVHNVETGEFKQVGRSCLRDYTGGYDAELAAAYIEMHDSLIEGEVYDEGSRFYSGYTSQYHDVNKVIKMSKAIITRMGFVSSQEPDSSKGEMFLLEELLACGSNKFNEHLIDNGVVRYYEDFNDEKYIQAVKEYYVNSDDTTSYMQNMKTIFKSDYCKHRDYGYIISAVFSYDKAMEKKAKREAAEAKRVAENELSKYIGNIGDKVTLQIKSGSCVASNEDGFGGYSYLYKFVDVDDNVIMWSTGKWFEADKVNGITGKVKDHREFRDLKQTWITRCKVSFVKEEAFESSDAATFDVFKVLDEMFKDMEAC